MSQVPTPVTLAPPNPTTVALHGSTVAAIGDINADGRPDIIVGSYFGTGNVGRVYLYSGATGQRIRQLGQPIVEVDGLFGYALAGVPDVNGDGVPDVAVGAPNDSPGTSPAQCGRVYLYSGATGGFLRSLVPPVAESFGNFGEAVAGIADVNGDGRGDVVVGYPREDRQSGGSNSDSGRVFIYSGATGQRIRTITPIAPEDSGEFGEAVAVTADINGDGVQDIIIGAPKERPDDAGRVYVYSGATGAFLRKLLPPTPQNDGRFGESVAGVPDATGDGVPEIVVGAPREFGHAGRAYIFNGATGVLIRGLVSPGNEPDGRFGTSVSGVPDMNNDGRGEVIVGASHEDPGTSPNNNGRAYIFSGVSGAFLFKLIPPSGNSSEEFGYSVTGIGDTNGNGRGEVVVGAPGDDNGSNNGDGNAFHYRF
ncbi:MAG: FG-GAP-like repeat-containing protein [Phycisphaerales bacterium]